MLNSFSWIRRLFLNRVSLGLILIDTVIFGLVVGTSLPEDFFRHFDYQPVAVRIFLIANIPSLAIAGLIVVPIVFSLTGLTPNSDHLTLQLWLVYLVSIIQWSLLGALIAKLFNMARRTFPSRSG